MDVVMISVWCLKCNDWVDYDAFKQGIPDKPNYFKYICSCPICKSEIVTKEMWNKE
jgi:hypothetical protein